MHEDAYIGPIAVRSMLFELVVVAAVVYASHRFRPDPTAFSKYFDSLHRKESIIGAVGLFLTGSGRVRHFEYTDAFICWIVRVPEVHEAYLGIFNSWFPISSFFSLNQATAGEEDAIEMGKAQCDSVISQLTSQAHQLKAASQYEEAAVLYEKVSKKAESGSDPFAAAELMDEAAKCYKMCHKYANYVNAVEKAASMYQKRNRNGRAAVILEKAGKYCLELSDQYLTQALKFLDRAQHLYEVESDGRWEGVEGEKLQVYARMGRWEEAAKGFIKHALQLYNRDPLMINTCNRYLLMSLFCSLDNEQLFVRRVTEYSAAYPWFAKSREHNLARLMADVFEERVVKDSVLMEQLESEKYMIPSMPNWFESKWNEFICRVKEGQDDLC